MEDGDEVFVIPIDIEIGDELYIMALLFWRHQGYLFFLGHVDHVDFLGSSSI